MVLSKWVGGCAGVWVCGYDTCNFMLSCKIRSIFNWSMCIIRVISYNAGNAGKCGIMQENAGKRGKVREMAGNGGKWREMAGNVWRDMSFLSYSSLGGTL